MNAWTATVGSAAATCPRPRRITWRPVTSAWRNISTADSYRLLTHTRPVGVSLLAIDPRVTPRLPQTPLSRASSLLPWSWILSVGLVTTAIDRETSPGLAHRHQLQAVDVDVGGGVHDPENRIGNVLRLDRFGACIGGVGLGLVTGKTHQRKLAFAQARLQIGDARPGPDQIVAQVQRELSDKRLGAAIHVTARVRIVTRHGA